MNVLAQKSFDVVTFSDKAGAALPESIWLAAGYILLALVSAAAFLSILGMVLIYVERKIAAHFQCRLGPMRVGWHGILQTVADSLKLLLKEDIVPERADRILFFLAPTFSLLATILALVIIPFSPSLQIVDLNIGLVFIAAVGGFGVLGILLAGWSSNNKWSLLGAMRAGAQFISYEISVILSLLVAALFAGSLQLSEIVQSQADGWWIWRGHLVGVVAFIIFGIASTAELNRPPFDLPEAESELTGGYHTEYSGLRFSFFFLSEFINMFIAAALGATLFLGGWMPFHIGGMDSFNAVMDLIPPGLWFAGKTAFLIFLTMWVRWTFPRLRVDQLMRLEWKFLLPVGIVNLMLAACIIITEAYFFPQ
ncbi:MAG: NADH-quinone oxidoreductase subunit NuoH [candidate division Zixibacteria bacterium]